MQEEVNESKRMEVGAGFVIAENVSQAKYSQPFIFFDKKKKTVKIQLF